jgi:GNAT superfamily N-acetyltransferase
MDLFFRPLTTEDIPAIKRITSDIWEGDDYVPKVIDQWLRTDDGSMNFGVFRDPLVKSEMLVGLGRIKWLSTSKVWIEGGRIDPRFQKQGIGLHMTQYAVEYARTHGATTVQYDTWGNREHLGDPAYPQNHASVALARRLGFEPKDYVDVLELAVDGQFLFPDIPSKHLSHKLSCEQAFEFYKHLPSNIGPVAEINQGWTFIPFDFDFFVSLKNNNAWYHNDHAIAQLYNPNSDPIPQDSKEVPLENEFWITVYGEPAHARHLVIDLLQKAHRKLPSNSQLKAEIFCPPVISPALLSLGCHFIEKEDSSSGVMLFEKTLKLSVEKGE